MSANANKFGAAAAAAGYLYQVRLALAEALKFAYSESGIEVSVERFDDVAFESDGEPLTLLQTKHHIKSTGDLTDTSADLWKTIRIWSERAHADPSLPSRVRLHLVTTATAPHESVAALLRPVSDASESDIDTAATKLAGVASTSKNKSLKPAFEAFLSLAPEMQRSLLRAVAVLDSAASLVDLEGVIESHLKMIAPRGKVGTAREQLEGWWWGRIVKALQDPASGSVAILEIEARLDDIRETMKRDALPVDMGDADPDDMALEALDELNFVKQLRMVRLGSQRIDYAKRDFYRASTQRSRWTRENLLFDGEVGRFEKILVEEWQPRFHAMCDKLGVAAKSENVRKAGQSLYQWVENEARFAFRNVSQRFLSVGSYNMLANDGRVGWHRDFAKTFGKTGED